MMAMMMAGANIVPADGWDPNSKASNLRSIVNSRHNLTMSYLPQASQDIMDSVRNNYGEVCVYCHTPHGGNTLPQMPLWNRTVKATTYTVYNSASLTQTASQPGNNSLTCLTCHDGQTAIDSIVNMPGSGNYSAAQQTSQDNAFLSTWTTPAAFGHMILGKSTGSLASNSPVNCTANCHNGTAIGAPYFAAFVIQTDLTNDHPVGVQLPDTGIYDFNAPNVTTASLKFYDTNGNSRADPNEIRFYNTGEGYEVECASCHDPHGVPSGGPGTNTLLQPSFLRVSNAGSVVCFTCHNK